MVFVFLEEKVVFEIDYQVEIEVSCNFFGFVICLRFYMRVNLKLIFYRGALLIVWQNREVGELIRRFFSNERQFNTEVVL